jgi:ubiquinone biosynthesis protein COQ4
MIDTQQTKASSPETVAPEDIVWIDGFPCPPAPEVRPLFAVASVLRLIRDKEDTSQVYSAVSALAGANGHRMFRDFVGTPYGRRVVAEPVRMEKTLSDREWLRQFPEGSFGATYLAFMEGEDLTPDGLLASAEEAGIDFKNPTQFEEYRRLFLHTSVMHDVWHVLTGYGRDALGELCNLAFSVTQTHNPGFRLIIAIGLIAQKLEQPGVPIIKAIREGDRMGRGVDYLLQHDIVPLLPLPLSEVREKLGFIEPVIYNSVPEDIKRNLLQPKRKDDPTASSGVSAAA